MLELWGMWSTLSLLLLPAPLWLEVVTSDRVSSMGQIELFDLLTVYLQNVYTDHVYNIYVKTEFGIK